MHTPRTARARGSLARSTAQSSRDDESGAATVEFVVVVSGLILVACTIGALCLYLATNSDVQQIAADLSRRSLTYVDRGFDESEVCAQLRSHHLQSLAEGLPMIDPDRVTEVRCAYDESGHKLKVLVSYDLAGTLAQRFGLLIGMDIDELNRAAELVL